MCNVGADFDHRSGELVPDGQRRLDPARSPIVPLPNVEIGAAYARRFDTDEDLASTYLRNRDVVYDQTGLRRRLADGLHRLGHVSVLMCIVG